jgi:Integrase core domain
MDISDARKLKALESENARLKKLLAEAELDKAMMKELLRKRLSVKLNGKVREEFLNEHWFSTMAELRHLMEVWHHDYNNG